MSHRHLHPIFHHLLEADDETKSLTQTNPLANLTATLAPSKFIALNSDSPLNLWGLGDDQVGFSRDEEVVVVPDAVNWSTFVP
jgi:hypothetical protein